MKIRVDSIDTERLVLRRFTMADLDDFIEMRNRPELYEYMIDTSKSSREEYESALQHMVDNYDSDISPTYTWAVVLKETGKVIGKTSIEHVYPKHNRVELGWSLHPDYQGHGYATEFGVAFINYVFNTTDTHRIHGFIWEGNISSRKLIEKLGFVYEGMNREARCKDGQYHNVWNFGLLRQEWENLDIYKGK